MKQPLTSTMSPDSQTYWSTLSTILDALGPDGQSSENTDLEDDSENDGDAHPLLVTIPNFRRRVLSSLLGKLDSDIKELQRKETKQAGKRYVSRPTRVRHRSKVISTRSTVKGLSRSCYHRQYLQRLLANFWELLKVENVEIPLLEGSALLYGDSNSEGEE